ncbi:hypothetical protein [Sulfurospirillum arcachonense]|uniref:hypothetical protein n=1 Tax=Sulfurospirillum arcachonense TaxID=57666 RepID=UPI0004ADC5B6|nr:hypothetical protein [Sulfurospirillum arcachonense]
MADKNVKNSFSEIISIDPVSLESYKYAKNEIQPFKLEKSKKNSFFISYIRSKDVISATVDISRNIPESDLQDAIEIKAYDDLGLDSAVEYTITYLETDTQDTKNRVFNVFVIDTSIVGSQLSEIRKKTSYIDYVTTAPFLIASLYKKALLESDGTDCFVYFQKNDAFLAIYKGGEYLYSKSLHYSLTELTEKFCELIGERIDEKDFYKLLTTEGLKSTNISYQSFLMQLFGELFLYINDVIVFAKRSYEIENIDKIYIGSEVGMLVGVDEYAKSYLGLDSFEFNFSIAINSQEWYVDQIHILMALTSQVYFENQDDALNFSMFKRPPAFTKRPVGKLFGIMAASLILTAAYPAYQYGYTQFLRVKTSIATSDYKKLNIEANKIRSKIAKLKKDKEKIDSLLKKESQKLQFRKKLLTQINKKKTAYSMKASILVELIEISNKYKSKIDIINYNKNDMKLSIQNRSEKKITEFIKELTMLKKYKITTDKIERVEKDNLYLSQITVGL